MHISGRSTGVQLSMVAHDLVTDLQDSSSQGGVTPLFVFQQSPPAFGVAATLRPPPHLTPGVHLPVTAFVLRSTMKHTWHLSSDPAYVVA